MELILAVYTHEVSNLPLVQLAETQVRVPQPCQHMTSRRMTWHHYGVLNNQDTAGIKLQLT